MHLKQSIAILKLILNLIGSQWRRINDDVTCSCLGNERLSPHIPAQKSVYFPRRGILFKQTFRHLEFYQSQKKILWFFLLWQVFRTWSTKSDLQRKYSPLEENIFINLLPLSVTIISPLSYIDKPSGLLSRRSSLKVYWRAYLALFRPSGCKKKYKHDSTIRVKIIVLWAVVQSWNFNLSAGKPGN